jgi:aminoglycoside phosphotransferase (APT) family kinase protein
MEGIDIGEVTNWYEQQVPGAKPPLHFERLPGGHSNLTYRVTDDAGEATVLRRPPLGELLPSAHDMLREFRVISALGPVGIPVAPAIGFCDDTTVTGARFYVMGYVAGRVLHTEDDVADWLDERQRNRAGQSLVEVAAALHAVDVEAVGLADLGRHDGYVGRQMKRWYGQYQQSRGSTPLIDRVHDELAVRVPVQQRVSVVHGDYRLGNCITRQDGTVAAVLDWEICTLGDPLADVGLLMVYWNESTDDHATLLAAAATTLPGFASRAELLERYGKRSGRDLSAVDFYVAFGYWKLACIVEGVYARYAHGAMGKPAAGFEAFATQTVRLADAAKAAVDKFT